MNVRKLDSSNSSRSLSQGAVLEDCKLSSAHAKELSFLFEEGCDSENASSHRQCAENDEEGITSSDSKKVEDVQKPNAVG